MKRKIITLCAAAALLFVMGGCDNMIAPDVYTDANEALRSLGYMIQPAEHAPEVTPVEPEDPNQPPDLPGYYNTVTKEKVANGFDETLCLDPTTSVIWLGSILDGNTITSGGYIPITARRGPLTFSMGGPFVNVQSVTVPEATLSKVREGIRDIVTSGVIGKTPNNTQFTSTSVYSLEQLGVSVGLNFHGWGLTVNGSFNFSNQNVRTRMFMKFLQVYYTLDIDEPVEPIDFFAPGTTWTDLSGQINGSVSPVYVASVKYGRIGTIAVESDYSEQEVEAALSAAYNAGIAGGGIDIGVTYTNIINNSTINVKIYGGSGEDGCQVTDCASFINWVKAGAEYSIDDPGAPIAYTLKYLKDRSVARIVLADEYYVRHTVPIQNKFRIRVMSYQHLLNDTKGYLFKNLYMRVYSGYDVNATPLTNDLIWSASSLEVYPQPNSFSNVSKDFNFDSAQLDQAYIRLIFSNTAQIPGYSIKGARALTIQEVIDNIQNNGYSGDNPDGCYFLDCLVGFTPLGGQTATIGTLRVKYTIEPFE
ncbi:MAG: thiol-activated cytolysin family protein [Spirochaetales bacterium]|nr:thiol-activated cytolysin family protein [Spirochaetales bacterium]